MSNKIVDDYGREYEIVTGVPKGFWAIYATWDAEGQILACVETKRLE